jgi:hypothetical protein
MLQLLVAQGPGVGDHLLHWHIAKAMHGPVELLEGRLPAGLYDEVAHLAKLLPEVPVEVHLTAPHLHIPAKGGPELPDHRGLKVHHHLLQV